MSVPKAAVDKNYFIVTSKDYVWGTRQGPEIDPEAVTHPMQN